MEFQVGQLQATQHGGKRHFPVIDFQVVENRLKIATQNTILRATGHADQIGDSSEAAQLRAVGDTLRSDAKLDSTWNSARKEASLSFSEFVYMVGTKGFQGVIPGEWHKSASAMRNFRRAFDIGAALPGRIAA